MRTADIRDRWLTYFGDRGHTVVPSASLVSDDPTVMFTIAGMVPFIPYLTGVVPAPFPRATSVQKCIRTNDIEEVGKTARHGTFFQMNGNFSFGDYFKEGAIGYAWELLTTAESDGGLGFAERDLWVTVYEDDDEAIELWKKVAGLPEERIQRLGKSDNYWSTGQPGPAGPCSEIYFDRGPAYGPDGGPAVDDTRYTEIWNLVFMQYQIDNVRSKTDFDVIGELPKKNIDTGMGLERVAFIKQGVENMYEIDQVRPVLDRASEISGKRYGANHEDDVRFRVIADHIRSGLMLMSDGVVPGNEGGGYILRRLLRRSIRSMRLLGVQEPVFAELFAASRDAMKAAYPEVETDYARIQRLAIAEEEAFLRTLSSGTTILDTAISRTKSAGAQQLPSDIAFQLHDTYGFPIDLTLEIAEEAGLTVDRAGFDSLMNHQRQTAKADAKAKRGQLADLSVYREFRGQGETVFTGYDYLTTESQVVGILVDGHPVQSAKAGQTAEVILSETSLYAESGGQDADSGVIVGPGYELDVIDVQRPVPGLIAHTVIVRSGEVGVGQAATTIVDETYRRGANRAHSATHLVHASLRQILGPNAHQAGSYNKAGYLRLDFNWSQALSPETKSEVEEVANRAVSDDLEVTTRIMSLDEARALGAMALFGEKYGDTVRVVRIGDTDWSLELCAGTHVARSSDVGVIDLVGESSVGAQNRRVEALVGADALASFRAERDIVARLASELKSPREEVLSRVEQMTAALKAAEKRIAELESRALAERAPALVSAARDVAGVRFVSANVGAVGSANDVRTLVNEVKSRLGSDAWVVALVGTSGEQASVVIAVSPAAQERGLKAGALALAASTVLGGRGGGRDDMAQGGGSDLAAIPGALAAVEHAIRG